MVIQTGFQCSERQSKLSDIALLKRFLCLGTVTCVCRPGDHREYKSEDVSFIYRLIQLNKGAEVVDIIRQYSEDKRVFKQNSLLFALTVCARSTDLETKRKAYSILKNVCRIPTFLFTFVDYCEKLGSNVTGWGRAHRRAISNMYNEYPGGMTVLARHVTKYKKRGKWSHKDVLRLAHVRPSNHVIGFILKYITKGLQNAVTSYGHERITRQCPEIGTIRNFLQGVNEAKHCFSTERLRALIQTHNLSWEHVPNKMLTSPVWHDLLQNMPIHALLRNLGRLTAANVLCGDDLCGVIRKITNVETVSNVHPLEILRTYFQYKIGKSTCNAQQERRPLIWRPIVEVEQALEHSYFESIKSVEPTYKKFLIGIDMTIPADFCVTSCGSLKAWHVILAMVLTSMKTEDCILKAFARTVVPLCVDQNDGIADMMNMCQWGPSIDNCDYSLPITTAIEEDTKVDVFVIYTAKNHSLGNQTPKQALDRYKRSKNPNARLIFVNICTPIDDSKIEGNIDGDEIFHVEGLDSNVLQEIREIALR